MIEEITLPGNLDDHEALDAFLQRMNGFFEGRDKLEGVVRYAVRYTKPENHAELGTLMEVDNIFRKGDCIAGFGYHERVVTEKFLYAFGTVDAILTEKHRCLFFSADGDDLELSFNDDIPLRAEIEREEGRIAFIFPETSWYAKVTLEFNWGASLEN